MRRPAAVVILTASLFILLLTVHALAGPFEDAEKACERGDYKTAHRIFKSLAEQGDAMAQYNLGVMYDKGQGVPQDYAEAAKWLRKAAEQGHAMAQHNLAIMYHEGQGVTQDYAEAASWFRKAAEQGYAKAQYNLAIAYHQGHGVMQDYVLAHMWFDLAASSQSDADMRDKAARNKDIVASKMIPAQIAEAQRLAREWKPKKEQQGKEK